MGKILIAFILSLPFLLSGSDNHWENGDGTTYTPPPSATNPPFDGVVYTKADVTGGPYSFTGVFCSSGVPSLSKSSQLPQSHLNEDTCLLKLDNTILLSTFGKYQQAYNSAKDYIESCPYDDNVTSGFTLVSGSNGGRSDNNSRFAECREWLKTVLYLNSDTSYYCADVMAIFKTFFWFNDERGTDFNGSNAVVKYLLESNRCPDSREWLINGYEANRQEQIKHYRDTVQDSLVTPLDTTLPTLEDLGLGILRGQTGVVAAISNSSNCVASLSVERNPFNHEVALKVELNSSTMLRLDIFDELGRSVYSEDLGINRRASTALLLTVRNGRAGHTSFASLRAVVRYKL